MVRQLILMLAAALALHLVSPAEARAKEHLIYLATWQGCELTCQGFVDAIEASNLDAEIIVRDAEQTRSRLPDFVAEARALDADLVVTIGTSVTLGLVGSLDDPDPSAFIDDRPVVFTSVADPFTTRIAASFDGSGRDHIAGTFNRVPEAVNIQTIRTYMPEFETLGMLYAANEPNSVNKVEEMKRLGEELGYRVVAIEINPGHDGVPDPALIDERMAEVAAAGVDFMYLGSSSFLRVHKDAFTSAAMANGLPILSPYESIVRSADALISVAAREDDVGAQAAEQALRILRDGESPGDLPVAEVSDFAFVINMDVARKLGLFPPIELLQVADTVN